VGAIAALGQAVARGLERAGVIEASRVRRVVDLTWPRVITGFARNSQQTADLAMVGLAVGPAAIAGVTFAFAYWRIAMSVSLGVAGGTISLVAQRFGAEDHAAVDLAVKQSVWVMVAAMVPVTVAVFLAAEPLIRLLGAEPGVAGYGATYLRLVALAFTFEALNHVGSRAFAGVGDTVTPMYLRAGGATVNIVVNAVLIFGLGMGVLGAAVGTVAATILTTVAFSVALLAGRLPGRGPFPVRVRPTGPHWDTGVLRRLLRLSVPLVFRRLAETLFAFPFLAVVAGFGSVAVAAYGVALQVRRLLNSLNWGFSIAASTLVGQHLGAGDEDEAVASGWDIVRLSLVVYVLLAVIVVVFAEPVSRLFVSEPGAVEAAAAFVRVAAVSSIGLGLERSTYGTLRGAGDTAWPFYGKLVGLYGFALPIAVAGSQPAVGIGLLALYLAFVVETFVPAAGNLYRQRSNAWLRASRPEPRPTGD
jgi:putative MATE family efflux protein